MRNKVRTGGHQPWVETVAGRGRVGGGWAGVQDALAWGGVGASVATALVAKAVSFLCFRCRANRCASSRRIGLLVLELLAHRAGQNWKLESLFPARTTFGPLLEHSFAELWMFAVSERGLPPCSQCHYMTGTWGIVPSTSMVRDLCLLKPSRGAESQEWLSPPS